MSVVRTRELGLSLRRQAEAGLASMRRVLRTPSEDLADSSEVADAREKPGATSTPPDWAVKHVVDAMGFDTSRSVLEMGGGDLARGVWVARHYPGKRVVGSDYELSAKALETIEATSLPNFRSAVVDVRDIDLEDETFDFVFSVALMEHIAELEECLAEVERVLRPGGVYYFIQAPFWSCSQGHHYRHWDDRTFDFIPKYGHLTMSREQMEEHLSSGPAPPFVVDECLQSIYDRPDLSRLTRDETRTLIENGPLTLASWTDYDDRRFDQSLAVGAERDLEGRISVDQMEICGAYVALQKPA